MNTFDSKSHCERRAILWLLHESMKLSYSKRLHYIMGGRPGYDWEPLNDILWMIDFASEEQKVEFLARVNTTVVEACACTQKRGVTGPRGICPLRADFRGTGPTGPHGP
jgi:hypothetical protein